MPLRFCTLALALCLAQPAFAQQGTPLAFDELRHDATQALEITANQLELDQTGGSAVFSGDVLAIQGAIRISAGRVEVLYLEEDGQPGHIARLDITENVLVATPGQTISAGEAIYDVDANTISLIRDVVLTQGPNVLSGQRLTINLTEATGLMEGRVRAVITTGNSAR